MKRWLFAAAAALTCALAFGQGATVILGNQEDVPFYYVLDPPQLDGLSSGSPLLTSKVAGYFSAAETGASFASVQPQAESRLTGLASGAHLLVGFFVPPDADDFPVRVMSLQADTTGGRFYAVYATPPQLNVHRGVGRLAQFAGSATGTQAAAASGAQGSSTGQAGSSTQAGTPAGTQAVSRTGAGTESSAGAGAGGSSAGAGEPSDLPTLASFSASFDPVVFTRETAGDFKVLPISNSWSWQKPGTRIASVQGWLDSQGLRLVLKVPGGFSPSVSYFLYVFDTRSAGSDNALTLEIEPLAKGTRGACILWEKGSPPRLLGSVTTTAGSVQLDVGAEDLEALVAAGQEPTVDLTAGWYDKALGMWEEFYYTTLTPTR